MSWTLRSPLGKADLAAAGAALGSALVGALLFAALGWPMPWLLGAMAGTALAAGVSPRFAATRPVRFGLAGPLRNAALYVLGLQIGAALTPQSAERLLALPGAAVLLALGTAGAMLGGYIVYRRLGGWDPMTAFLGAAPGAHSTVLALVGEARVDARRVMLAQSLRLGALIVIFPLAFPAPDIALASSVWTWRDAAIALPPAALVGWLLHRRGTPAAWVLGPAVVGAALTVTGVVHGAPPLWALNAALLGIGAATGAKVAQAGSGPLGRDAFMALLGFVAMGVGAGAAALVAMWAFDLPLGVALLAFAPGGFEAMIALSVALDLDPALVGAAHVLRVLGLTLALPFAFKRLMGGGQ